MRNNTEIPVSVLDASRTETTTPEASAATDADQSGEAASASTTTPPDSNEDSGTDSEEMHMESTPAPETAQSQDQEHAPLAMDASLPAAGDQDSSQAQIVKSEKKSTALTPKRSHKKKKANSLSRAQVADMAASEACPAATPSTFAFGMQGSAEETRGQFVYPHTDLGNAQMFYRLFNKFFMYDRESGQWIGWDDNRRRWISGSLARQVMSRLVQKLITKLYRHAQSRRPLRTRNGETVTPEEALKWAKATSEKGRQKAILDQVRDFPVPGVKVSKAELDQDPCLLGVANGVLDLRTGTLIENRPDLRITRYANAAYRPEAEAPIFKRFMDEICLGRQDLVDYLQEVFGYVLSGLIKEHAFFILLGTGANGKSTLVETFLHLLGDYGIGMPGHAFLKSNSRAIRNDIARLPGVRIATSAEVNTDTSVDESMIKCTVAGDVMTARFIGKEYFDFHPQAKFFLSVNTLPKITGADNGIYRRLKVIPFDGNFKDSMDKDLPEKLKAEIDGILTWP